jgi:hypothetical protein
VQISSYAYNGGTNKMLPDEPNDEELLEKLPGDYETPFSIPKEIEQVNGPGKKTIKRPVLDSTHPATDGGMESGELYQDGVSAAAGAAEPNHGSAVTGYHKPSPPSRHPNRSM